MKVSYTICYLGSIKIMTAYCVGRVHNVLHWQYLDSGAYCAGKLHNMLPWQYEIMGAYCVGMIVIMLIWQYQDSESIL